MATLTTLPPQQMVQLQSFWNLIQSSDERVQHELYMMLDSKYRVNIGARRKKQPFLGMKGILNSKGSSDTDKQMIDEYLDEKYGL